MLRLAVFVVGVVLSLCSITLLLPVDAQATAKVYRIGVLGAGTAAQNATRMDAFRQGLHDLGWLDERAIAFDERWADGRYERLPALAAELIALKVDLILAINGAPAVEAAMKATKQIPIVFPTIGDPVAEGIVQSMAHPGGNATGLSFMLTELYPKRLALLKEAIPGTRRVALLLNPTSPVAARSRRLAAAASESVGIPVELFDVSNTADLPSIFEKISRTKGARRYRRERQLDPIGDEAALRTCAQLPAAPDGAHHGLWRGDRSAPGIQRRCERPPKLK